MAQFKRTKEDFTCEQCGREVKGNGYTNHCPKCLWGKHVDVNPGDRASSCGGMMAPTRVEGTVSEYQIVHTCTKCNLERRNKTAPNDDVDVLLQVVLRVANT